jgi:hypothetical protein
MWIEWKERLANNKEPFKKDKKLETSDKTMNFILVIQVDTLYK